MSERICVRDLNDILGFAVRSDHDVEVVISSAVPSSERASLAHELTTAVRSAPGRYATVVRHIRDALAPATPRGRTRGLVMAIAAALIINLGG